MNCEKFQGLLIEYVGGEIEPSDIELVKSHLATCQYCSKKLDEFKEIRRVFNVEIQTDPSAEVLARLSRMAREELEKEEVPFWRKWFYTPILVPVFSTGLALFIWISYGQKDVGYRPDDAIYSTKVMAKKMPMAQKPNIPRVGEETLSNLESNRGRLLSDETDSGPHLAPGKKSTIEVGKTARSGSPAPVGDMIAGRDVAEDAEYSRQRDEDSGKLGGSAIEEFASESKIEAEEGAFQVGPLSKATSGETGEQRFNEGKQESNRPALQIHTETTYNDKLDLGLTQQKEGNCKASIITNQELLKQEPPPTDAVKGKAFLSLGECYEQMGEWEKAVTNYKNLEKISPEQTALAIEKIESIERRRRLLKK